MARYPGLDLPSARRKGSRMLLAFSWLAGLFSGLAAGISAGGSLVSMMRGALVGSVSIVGLLCASVLPFLFSAFAVFLSQPKLLLPVAFAKAFLLSFVGLGVQQAFGCAGWLVRRLLCFSSCAASPVLYLYWLRHISGGRRFSAPEAVLTFSLCLLAGSIDFSIVAPFLARLITS